VVKRSLAATLANAYAERWVGTLRRECPDWLLIFGCRQLKTVLRVCTAHYNQHRLHRGLDLQAPLSPSPSVPIGQSPIDSEVRRQDRLGGLLHE